MFFSRRFALLLFIISGTFLAKAQTKQKVEVSDTLHLDSVLRSQGILRLPVSHADSELVRRYTHPKKPTGLAALPVIPGYRFGPAFGVFRPVQEKLVNKFHRLVPYYTIGLMPLNPKGGFSFSFDYYSIEGRPKIIPAHFPKVADNRFFLVGPTAGYGHWFKDYSFFRPFVEVDGEYLLGRLRIREENLDTPWNSTIGAYFLAGAVIANHVRFNISFAVVNPVHGYSMTGVTASISYLFMPFGYFSTQH